MVVSVFDVAAYILHKKGAMTTMKLHKLLYYCQAWSLVWDDKKLFREKIYAWRNGPVVASLFKTHKGYYRISRQQLQKGDARKLDGIQKETINVVLKYYGDKSSQWLSDLTHSEDPWRNAREGLPSDSSCYEEITLESMSEYYSSIIDE